jgi:uncharacterized membrane protein (DUF485 family)
MNHRVYVQEHLRSASRCAPTVRLPAAPPHDVPALARPATLASLVVALAPVAAVFAYVAAYGVNVPVWDDWDTVRVVANALSGHLSFHDLWALKGEHRVFFPRLAQLGLAYADRFDTHVEMYVVAASLVAILIALAFAARRTHGPRWILVVPLFAFVVFSFRQYENYLLGSQMQFAFAVGFAVLALYFVFRGVVNRSNGWLAVGAMCATISTYSSGGAFVVWVAGLLLLWSMRLQFVAWNVVHDVGAPPPGTNNRLFPAPVRWLALPVAHRGACRRGGPLCRPRRRPCGHRPAGSRTRARVLACADSVRNHVAT